MRHILKSEIFGGSVLFRGGLIALEAVYLFYFAKLLGRVISGTGDAADIGYMLGLLVLIVGSALILRAHLRRGISCVPYYGESMSLRELAKQLDDENFRSIESDSAVVRAVTKVSQNWVKICSKYYPKSGLQLIELKGGFHSYYYIARNDGIKYSVDYLAPVDAIIMLFWDTKIIEDLSRELGIKTRKQLNDAPVPDQMVVSSQKRKIVTDEGSITVQEKSYLENKIRPLIENNIDPKKKGLVALGRYIYGPGRAGCFKFKGYWFVYEVDELNECVIDGLYDVKEAAYILVSSALDMPGIFPDDMIPEEGRLYKSFSSLDGITNYLNRNKKKLSNYKK